MARTNLAVAVVVGSLGVAAPSAMAAPPPVGTVVLHVTAYARVPASELADAEAAAAKAYARAGVRLVWTGGAAATAAPDGALHLDVLLLTAEMTERLRPAAVRCAGEGQPRDPEGLHLLRTHKQLPRSHHQGGDADLERPVADTRVCPGPRDRPHDSARVQSRTVRADAFQSVRAASWTCRTSRRPRRR